MQQEVQSYKISNVLRWSLCKWNKNILFYGLFKSRWWNERNMLDKTFRRFFCCGKMYTSYLMA